jgi:hypothetical protein
MIFETEGFDDSGDDADSIAELELKSRGFVEVQRECTVKQNKASHFCQ